MTIRDFLLHTFLIPLLTIYHGLFVELFNWCRSPGTTIVFFSIVLNIVLLPIYYRMELSGRKEKENRERMFDEVKRIKKHYKGRERYFYIKTIYRQARYNPITPVFSAIDLYLQVFIFVSVLYYFKGLPLFQNASFFFISDLSKPDEILWGVNLLPILMTAINLVSATFYTQEKSKRLQAYGMAILFLVLLYPSPAALVLYWTTNNLFSLIKNWVEFKLLPPLKPYVVKVAELFSKKISTETPE